jgi:DNA polymerase III subunit delta
MAKVQHRSIYEIPELASKEKLLPVFFLCGEDTFAIDGAVKILIDAIEPLIGSEFDKEIITADKKLPAQQVVDLALTFPFGGTKKLIVVKEFNNIDDKKLFVELVKNPPEYLYLVLTQSGKVNATKIEPYASLHKNKLMFEARKLKQDELADWLVKHAKKNKITLSYENALAITEIVGDEKSLLENQLQKFYDNVGEGNEITFDVITNLASTTRKYTTFNLNDEIGRGNKAKALEIAYNLLDSGTDMGQLISGLTRYCILNTQAHELTRKKLSIPEAAKEADANYYYYMNSTKSNIFKDKTRLLKAAQALYHADLTLKTSAVEKKTVLAILISEMISN